MRDSGTEETASFTTEEDRTFLRSCRGMMRDDTPPPTRITSTGEGSRGEREVRWRWGVGMWEMKRLAIAGESFSKSKGKTQTDRQDRQTDRPGPPLRWNRNGSYKN